MARAGDLVVLAADGDTKQAIEGLLSRPVALGIRPVDVTYFVHPEHDPGCLLRSSEFLRPHLRRFDHALVVFDREGCGRDGDGRVELEARIEQDLIRSGWDDRAAAVACDPELEVWVWSRSPRVEESLGWKGRAPGLRAWLVERGFCDSSSTKPGRPKEALVAALRAARKPRSSSLDFALGQSVTFDGCMDLAFLKLLDTVRRWYPP